MLHDGKKGEVDMKVLCGVTEDCVDVVDLGGWGITNDRYKELSDAGLMPPALAWDAFTGDGICWDLQVFREWFDALGVGSKPRRAYKSRHSVRAKMLKEKFKNEKFDTLEASFVLHIGINAAWSALNVLTKKKVLNKSGNEYWFD